MSGREDPGILVPEEQASNHFSRAGNDGRGQIAPHSQPLCRHNEKRSLFVIAAWIAGGKSANIVVSHHSTPTSRRRQRGQPQCLGEGTG